MITRQDFGTNPPHVEYRLTELEGSLMAVIDTMREWSERYLGAAVPGWRHAAG